MRTQPFLLATALMATLTAGATPAQAQSPLTNRRFVGAFTSLNAPNCASLTFTATGTLRLEGETSATAVTQYAATLNYGPLVSRVTLARAGKPRTLVQHYSDGAAWDVRDGKLLAQPRAVTERILGIRMTPHGVLSAAMAPGAKVTFAEAPGADGQPITTLVVELDGGPSVKATLGANGTIDKVETLPGATPAMEMQYSAYKDFDGVKFPTRIVVKTAGTITADLTVTSMQTNVGLYLDVPEKVLKAKK